MIAILLGQGFEEIEALSPYDILRRGGASVQLVALEDVQVTGGQGVTVVADTTLAQLDVTQVDCVVLPGGLRGVASLEGCPKALDLVKTVAKGGGTVAAICAAPRILQSLGLLDGRQYTGYPSAVGHLTPDQYHPDFHVVVDGNLVTAKAAGSSITFGKVLLGLATERATAMDVIDKIYATTESVLWHKEVAHGG